mgnify:CR=1 FL=1
MSVCLRRSSRRVLAVLSWQVPFSAHCLLILSLHTHWQPFLMLGWVSEWVRVCPVDGALASSSSHVRPLFFLFLSLHCIAPLIEFTFLHLLSSLAVCVFCCLSLCRWSQCGSAGGDGKQGVLLCSKRSSMNTALQKLRPSSFPVVFQADVWSRSDSGRSAQYSYFALLH